MTEKKDDESVGIWMGDFHRLFAEEFPPIECDAANAVEGREKYKRVETTKEERES
jgi:hypothetical protein